jgi:hypothetical protein
MESLKTHLVVWLSGLVTGLILMESWRRLGDRDGAADGSAGKVTDTATASPAPADTSKGLKSIVAGATAEAERARRLLSEAMPWTRNQAASLAGSAPTSRTRSTGSVEGNDGSPAG